MHLKIRLLLNYSNVINNETSIKIVCPFWATVGSEISLDGRGG